MNESKFVEYHAAERKKELPAFTTAWMELESIKVSEISGAGSEGQIPYHLTFNQNIITGT